MEANRVKRNGIHYTPARLARFLAEQTVRFVDPNQQRMDVLDPACGDGQLLSALLTALPFPASDVSVSGFDRDLIAAKNARRTLADFESKSCEIRQADFLEFVSDYTHPIPLPDGVGTLAESLSLGSSGLFDCVIANPPYVRTQVLGGEQAQQLASKFGLTGRVDLYQAFVFAMSRVLRPGGVLGLLTSNRFLTVKAGQAMRRLLAEQFSVKAIYDLGDTKLFGAAVLPVVLVAVKKPCEKHRPGEFHRIYASVSDRDAKLCSDVLDELSGNALGEVASADGRFNIERGQLKVDSHSGVWSLENELTSGWLAKIRAHQVHTFADVAEIKVGIKTTADRVFIKDDWEAVDRFIRPERRLLQSLLTHHDAQRWSFAEPAKKKVLYPYEMEQPRRTVVSIAKHPKAFAYLEQHRQRLESRKYVVESGRQWFEIWVPHQPRGWAEPKIVWPDISEQPRFFLDSTGAIVNGDCYWIKLRDGVDPNWLYMMLAVANSQIATHFYDVRFHNKLYAGRRRFMTQYVKEFPLPDIVSVTGRKIISVVKQLIEDPTKKRESRCEQLVHRAFGFS